MSRQDKRRHEVAHRQGAAPAAAPISPGESATEPSEVGVEPVTEADQPPRLLDAIAALEKDDPAAARPLATLHAAGSDFLRVVGLLPGDLTAEVRAALDAVLERL